jgi:hypothetical protein
MAKPIVAKTLTISHLVDYELSKNFFIDPCFRINLGPSSSDFNTATATCRAELEPSVFASDSILVIDNEDIISNASSLTLLFF